MNDKEIHIALGKLFSGLDLKAEKVEFSIANEVKDLYSKYIDTEEEVDAAYNKVFRAADDLKSIQNKLEKVAKEATNLDKKLEKAISELGVNRNTFGLDDQLKKAKDNANRLANNLRKDLQKINSIG